MKQMTPTKYLDMFNSGNFNKELENFHVSRVTSARGQDENERMITWIKFNPENEKIINASLSDKNNQKDVIKVKTQAL